MARGDATNCLRTPSVPCSLSGGVRCERRRRWTGRDPSPKAARLRPTDRTSSRSTIATATSAIERDKRHWPELPTAKPGRGRESADIQRFLDQARRHARRQRAFQTHESARPRPPRPVLAPAARAGALPTAHPRSHSRSEASSTTIRQSAAAVLGARPERDELLARAEPVTGQAHDVGLGRLFPAFGFGLRSFRLQRFADLPSSTAEDDVLRER